MSIELPDFLRWTSFNGLRTRVRAPLAAPFAKRVEYREIELSTEELLQTRGIDVDADDIEVLQDGTLGYKGRRVLVYIRDVNVMGNREHMPRYHFAFCATLSKMHQNERGERYVVATRDTGLFEVNVIGSTVQPKDVRLNVCQNCLVHITWNGFGYHQAKETRVEQVKGFTLVDFFEKYPRDLLSMKPKYTSDDAPINTYPQGWENISSTVRRLRGYRCESCSLDLSAHPRYLHVHHRNGQKNDNRDNNLVALCIGCHAQEPLHAHIRHLPDALEFRRLYGTRE
ncbi:HNH endonuclease [Caballeronia sp. LZ029]|uniref:HNH endonuclease n=1 Tax=Caballeronia sp. LZ029 TaxID=3038564 RepID=UPI00285DCE10|nr:HNH endonuclease [Caballeronia sp. LZ029]MDR5746770.1 HNH endonuclease [Caballeronia sp. LZ029]